MKNEVGIRQVKNENGKGGKEDAGRRRRNFGSGEVGGAKKEEGG